MDPDQNITLFIYKSPKVGGNPAGIVTMVTNCTFGSRWMGHVRGYFLQGSVYGWRKLAGVVDTTNLMNLHYRERLPPSDRCGEFAGSRQLRIIAGNNTLFKY